MRVLFVEQESRHLGGVQVTTIDTAVGLHRQGFSVQVVCPEPGELTSRLEACDIPIHLVPRPHLYSVTAEVKGRLITNPAALAVTALSTWKAAHNLTGFLRGRADIVVTKGLITHFYGGWAAARAGLPCVWHVQEVVNLEAAGGLYPRLLSMAARRWARMIIVDAATVGAQFAPDLRANGRVRLLYNGVDVNRFSPTGACSKLPVSQEGEDSPIIIGQIGRIVPLKGQIVLLEAFRDLNCRYPNLHLVFVGKSTYDNDNYPDRLEDTAAAWGLADRVHFLGFRQDIPEILRAFDIFVHPSIEADSPVAILEALAVGRPVVATRVPGTVELLRDGVDSILVPPSDSQALGIALARLIENRAERQRLASAARAVTVERFSLTAHARTFAAMLEEVVV